jgi:hypothetical protein
MSRKPGGAMFAWARVVAGSGVLLAAAAAALWAVAFRTPSPHQLPLPSELIAFDSAAGRDLLDPGFLADHAPLIGTFESQTRRAFCGVASSVVVLNALGATDTLTQTSFFTPEATRVRTSLEVTLAGMTLAELAALLRAHGADVTTQFASDTTLDDFRSVARRNLATPGDFLLVNYEREALGQIRSGHISPLAAYNEATDRFLILDVAAYRYPPVWVSARSLWEAMSTLDRASGRTRGFVTVRAGP